MKQTQWLMPVVLAGSLIFNACTSADTHEATARLFLDQYLVATDQEAAILLTTGRARADIQEEIDLLANVENRDQLIQESRPKAHFDKIYEKPRPNGDVAYLFRAEFSRQGMSLEPRDVFLLVTQVEGVYKIKSFSFRSPSDSHTSDKP